MRILLVLAVCASLVACKARQTGGDFPDNPLTSGTVSHQYSDAGCSTVILVQMDKSDEVLTLIPRDKLPAKFDKDGLKVLFNYQLLRMPNPAGCETGIPAEIKNLKSE